MADHGIQGNTALISGGAKNLGGLTQEVPPMRIRPLWTLIMVAILTTFHVLPLASNALAQAADVPVRALIEAMAAGDAARIRAQFAPTATQAYGADGPMKTAAATARWLETDIISRNGKVTNPQFAVSGNQVVVRGNYSSRGYTSKADFLFTVDNGKITSWRMRY